MCRSTSRLVTLAAVLATAPGCGTATRGANRLGMGGIQILATGASQDRDAGVSGLVSLQGAAEVVGDDDFPIAGSMRSALAIGGNVDGVAGKAQLDGSIGVAPGRLHAVHAKIGFASLVEANAYNGFRYLELPTFATGYTFHGQDTNDYADSMHFHVGPRVALALAGGIEDGDRGFNFGLAPDLGGEITFAGELLWFDGRYRAFMGPTRIDAVEIDACLAFLVAACVETRHLVLPGNRRTTSYVGFTIGFGLSSGLDYSDSW